MMDNTNELFPIVDEEGNTLGVISRGEAHNGSRVLHPVVHLHLFNTSGALYLQRRPLWKDIQPGRWDTACGGHIAYGETPEEALLREVSEELGITAFIPTPLGRYVFDSKRERELVYVNKAIYDGVVTPNTEELDGGRFWSKEEILDAMGKGILTPNFEQEYLKFFG